jgi:ATP-dependent 26S proteasome regulatory subunit
MIERQAPCVLLFDEVEKLFGNENEEGTTTRILSLILWWLQEHRSKIVTIMTTNNLKAIPRELYRPGRIDQVIKIAMLTIPEAKLFALRVYESVLGTKPGLDHQKAMREAIEALHRVRLSHSATAEIVYKLIKAKSWIELDILKELMLTN